MVSISALAPDSAGITTSNASTRVLRTVSWFAGYGRRIKAPDGPSVSESVSADPILLRTESAPADPKEDHIAPDQRWHAGILVALCTGDLPIPNEIAFRCVERDQIAIYSSADESLMATPRLAGRFRVLWIAR
jgi:hypothetical protein